MINIFKLKQNIEHKNMLYILFGVLFEKAFPFILGFLFIKSISNLEYGLWVLYFQVVLIFASTFISPLQLFFNREFKKAKYKKLKIYNFHLAAPIVIFLLLLFLIIYDVSIIHIVLCLFTIITLILNNLLFNYLRFSQENFRYLKFSLIRFICFVTFLISFVVYKNKILIEDLFIALIVSNLIVVIALKGVLKIEKGNYKVQEFIKLCLYGLLTLSLGGLDKIILTKTNLNLMDLAILGYALVFVNSTSIMLEAIKKYFSPIYFKDFNELDYYSPSAIKKTIKANIFLGIFQIVFPFLLFFLLDFLQLTKESLIAPEFFLLILLLSISLSIHNIYHFINPYLFYINKSQYLSLIIITAGIFFSICILSIEQLNLIKLSSIKIISSFILISLSYLFLKFQKQRRNV